MSVLLRQTRTCLLRAPVPAVASARTTAAPRRSMSASHGHEESPYDPPSGWLFGERPGEPVKKEGWEGVTYYLFFGSLGAAAIAYMYKPDTSIQTWALEEAARRLEKEGIEIKKEYPLTTVSGK